MKSFKQYISQVVRNDTSSLSPHHLMEEDLLPLIPMPNNIPDLNNEVWGLPLPPGWTPGSPAGWYPSHPPPADLIRPWFFPPVGPGDYYWEWRDADGNVVGKPVMVPSGADPNLKPWLFPPPLPDGTRPHVSWPPGTAPEGHGWVPTNPPGNWQLVNPAGEPIGQPFYFDPQQFPDGPPQSPGSPWYDWDWDANPNGPGPSDGVPPDNWPSGGGNQGGGNQGGGNQDVTPRPDVDRPSGKIDGVIDWIRKLS